MAIPAGIIADRVGSFVLVRVGSAMMLVSLFVVLVVINLSAVESNTAFFVIFGCLTSLGAAAGVSLAPMFTVFRYAAFFRARSCVLICGCSNSIPTGSRSTLMAYDSVSMFLGSTAGPLVALTILNLHGNEWSLPALTLPFSVGLYPCEAISHDIQGLRF